MSRRSLPRNLHDALVRRVFSRAKAVAVLLRHLLPPQCVAILDLDTLRRESTAYVGASLGTRCSDLLFTVGLRGTGHRIAIYVALEHQSTPDDLMPWRALEYAVAVWNRYVSDQGSRPKLLPFILPIVLLQRRAWSTPTRLSNILDLPSTLRTAFGTPIELELLVDDLSKPILDDSWFDNHNTAYVELARMLLYAHDNPGPGTERRLETFPSFFDHLLDRDDSDDWRTIWMYIDGAFGEEAPIHAVALRMINERDQAMYEDLTNPWVARGRKEGMARGRKEGMARGRAESLLDVLEQRALPLPAAVRERILSTTETGALERWFRRALTAASLDEIFVPGEPMAPSTGAGR